MTTLFKKYGPAVVMGVLSIALPQIALAAGTDTGESTATSIPTWLSTWIPIGCAIAIMVSCFMWMLHVIPASFIPRIVISLIGIGSASFLVSLTGVGSGTTRKWGPFVPQSEDCIGVRFREETAVQRCASLTPRAGCTT